MWWKNVFVFIFYQCFAKCKCKDQPKGRTETCGERNAVWQLGFARDALALFPTGQLARVSQAYVSQAFWAGKWLQSNSLCFGCFFSSISLNSTAEEPLAGPIPYVSIR